MFRIIINIDNRIIIRNVDMRSMVEDKIIITETRKRITIKMISIRKVNSRNMEGMLISIKRKIMHIMMMKGILKSTPEIMTINISKTIRTIRNPQTQITKTFQMKILLNIFPFLVQVNTFHIKKNLIFSHGKVNKFIKILKNIKTTLKTKMI